MIEELNYIKQNRDLREDLRKERNKTLELATLIVQINEKLIEVEFSEKSRENLLEAYSAINKAIELRCKRAINYGYTLGPEDFL